MPLNTFMRHKNLKAAGSALGVSASPMLHNSLWSPFPSSVRLMRLATLQGEHASSSSASNVLMVAGVRATKYALSTTST